MAGDVLNARADYYYQSPVTNNNNSLVIDVLVQAISGSSVTNANVKGGTAGITTNLNGNLPFASISDPNKGTTDNIPRSYLNIMFFDERFNFVPENSTAVRVSQPGIGAAPLVLPINTKAPKNGYAYIYLSNENDDAVYFDNLQVSDTRGRIIEEDHYYAFGLKIAGISSTKLPDSNEGNINNKNLYNDKELIDEADLNWYDYGFRNYDAQIGRFPQLDPLTWDYPELTNYQYASDEPIANVDLDGLEELNVLGEVFQGAKNAVQQGVTVVGHAAPKVTQTASTLSKVATIASMTANAAKLYTTLDGQKSLSSDIEKRLQVLQAKNGQSHSTPRTSYQESSSWKLFEKMVDDEINKSWVSQGSNKYVNSITGQTRYSPTAEEGLYPEAIFAIPMPKFGFVFKLLGRGGEAAAKGGKELFNFSTKAAEHMANPGRAVPVQILEQAIKGSKGLADPRGSRALMYTTKMFKNGKAYNLEVLYDKATNSIWHFQYSAIKP